MKSTELLKILIVTNNDSFSELIKELEKSFSKSKHKFVYIEHKTLNIKTFVQHFPDLILINETNKYDLIQFIKQKSKTTLNPIPVILFMNSKKEQKIIEYLSNGITQIIKKPWKIKLITEQIKSTLRTWNNYKQLLQTKYNNMKLFKITKKMHSTADLQELITIILDETKELFNISEINLLLLKNKTEKENQLFINSKEILTRKNINIIMNNFRTWIGNLELNDNLSEKVIMHYVTNTKKQINQTDKLLNIVFTNYIKTKDELIGIINFLDKDKKELNQGEIALASTLSQQLGISLKNILLFETLNYIARKDELTELFNRRYFNERFNDEFLRNKRYGRFFSCMMIDLDKFKQINDQFGHQKGDEVLIGFSKVLKKRIRKIDIAARYGGEEFIVLLPETTSEESKKIASRIKEDLKNIDFGIDRPVTASFGISCSKENKVETKQKMISQADSALYEAKEQGRDRIIIYKAEKALNK